MKWHYSQIGYEMACGKRYTQLPDGEASCTNWQLVNCDGCLQRRPAGEYEDEGKTNE